MAENLVSKIPSESILLKAYLQGMFTYPDEKLDDTIGLSYAHTDLDDDGISEIVVYLTGQTLCGSSGCRLLVLKRKGTLFFVAGYMVAIRLPVYILPTKSNGLRDISVRELGGGNIDGSDGIYKFNGTSYTRISAQQSEHGPPSAAINGVIELSLEKGIGFLYKEDI